LVGFSWRKRDDFIACNSCYERLDEKESFKTVSVGSDYWGWIDKEFNNNNVTEPSKLSAAQQHSLMQHALENGINDWDVAAMKVGLRSGHEAISEFFKIKPAQAALGRDTVDSLRLESFRYLFEHAKKQAEFHVKDLKPLEEVEPYSQVDQIYFQCDLLKSFANRADQLPEAESLDSKRLKKLKTKKAYKCILQEMKTIKEDL
jgi:hypothetical protein